MCVCVITRCNCDQIYLFGVETVMGIAKESGLNYEQLQKKILLFITALLHAMDKRWS